MRHSIRILAIAALTCAPLLPASAQQSTTASYSVSYNNMTASGTFRVQPAGKGQWNASMRISNLLASIEEVTIFDVSGGRLRPLGSSRHTRYPLGRKAITSKFDWGNRRVSWRGDVKPTQTGPLALATGDLEPLLVNLALVADAVRGKSPTYRVANKGKIRTQRYTNLGKTSLQVGGKQRDAIRMFNQNGQTRTVVWVVPGLALPARILQTEPGGDTIDLRMK
jgi:hypothetical protein